MGRVVAALVAASALLLGASASALADGAPARLTLTFLSSSPSGIEKRAAVVIRVANGWPTRAEGVVLTVRVPTWVRVSGPGCRPRPFGVRCTVGTLRKGEAKTVHILAVATRTGTYRIAASVSGRPARPLPAARSLSAAGGFRARVAAIPAPLARTMTGRSWRPGCPVGLAALRLVSVTFRGFDGRDHAGRVVVNRDVAADVVAVFRALYAAGFPIRRMEPVDVYGASDYRSIEADNTSAFNCREVAGTSSWSEHAYGRAIDLDPLENPSVSGGVTSHPASVRYLDRSLALPGMIHPGDAVVRAFRAVGWGWGGTWSSPDYQHFSASGR